MLSGTDSDPWRWPSLTLYLAIVTLPFFLCFFLCFFLRLVPNTITIQIYQTLLLTMALESYLPIAVPLAGVASHLFFFKLGERDIYPLRYLQAFLLACMISTVTQSSYFNLSTRDALTFTAQYAGLYLAGLYTSLIIYRLFFNPLNKIPGPYWARLSKFNFVFRVAAKLDTCHNLLELHQRHGKFVRIGPHDVSVTHPDGVEVIASPKSKCIKAQWYAQDVPLISMHTCRDRAQHDRRRRIWSPAFSDKALRGYENRIEKYNDLLLQKMEEKSGAF